MTTAAKSTNDINIVLTTCSTSEQAKLLAEGLLSAKLVACVNIIPGVQSWYLWDEKICHERELQLVIKTKSLWVADVMAWLTKHHPYETPEILVLPVKEASQEYLNWIQSVC